MKKLQKISLLTIIVSIFFSNIQLAYGFSNPIEGVFTNIATFFNFEMFHNDFMQLGFLRFMLWILLFAIINWAATSFVFKGEEGKKTGGIVAAIISLISVIFMPSSAVLAIGTAYSALVFTLLVVGIAFIGVYFGIGKLKGEFWQEILGFMVLVFTLLIMSAAGSVMGVF